MLGQVTGPVDFMNALSLGPRQSTRALYLATSRDCMTLTDHTPPELNPRVPPPAGRLPTHTLPSSGGPLSSFDFQVSSIFLISSTLSTLPAL
jgi:hypothetical protein